MKKHYYLYIFALLFSQLTVAATKQQPLSRKLVESYIEATEQIDLLEKKYPDVFKKADEFAIDQEKELLAYFKTSKAFPDITRALSQLNFTSMKNYLDISNRIMGGIILIGLENMPKGMTLNNMLQSLKDGIQMLKDQGADAYIISSMESRLKEQEKEIQKLKLIMKKISNDDKTFMKQNAEWLEKIFPDDIENNVHNDMDNGND